MYTAGIRNTREEDAVTMNRVKLVTLGCGFAALVAAAGCGVSVEGTYSDPNGAMKIELKGGGKGAMTFMNQTMDCTYTTDKSDKKKISLDCKEGTPMELTLSDDGTTLQMPPGSMIPSLKKK